MRQRMFRTFLIIIMLLIKVNSESRHSVLIAFPPIQMAREHSRRSQTYMAAGQPDVTLYIYFQQSYCGVRCPYTERKAD